MPRRSSRAFRLLSSGLVLVSLGFIGYVFVSNLDRIPEEKFSFRPVYLIAAFLLSPLSNGTSSWLWYRVLILLGERPAFVPVWRINMYSQIVRYAPGKIWNYLGRVYWGRALGMSRRNLLLSSVIDLILLMFGALAASLFSIELLLPGEYAYLPFPLMLLSLAVLHPALVSKLVSVAGARRGLGAVRLDFRYAQVFKLAAGYIVLWHLMGVQFFLFIRSFYPLALDRLPELIGINAASWVLGYLSFVAPAGVGVKEGVFVFAFKSIAPAAIAALSAVLLRLFIIVNEVLAAGIFFCFDRDARRTVRGFLGKPGLRRTPETEEDDAA